MPTPNSTPLTLLTSLVPTLPKLTSTPPTTTPHPISTLSATSALAIEPVPSTTPSRSTSTSTSTPPSRAPSFTKPPSDTPSSPSRWSISSKRSASTMSVGYGEAREKAVHPRMKREGGKGERYVMRGVVGGRKGEGIEEEEREWRGYVDEEGRGRAVGPFGGYDR